MGFKAIGILGLALIITTGLTLNVAGEDPQGQMCVPMGTIELQPPEGVEAKKAHVEFPHSVHFATDCKTCHHTWKGEENIKGCQTSGCHDVAEAPKKDSSYLSYSDESIKYFKYAYHKSCIGCHKETKAANKKRAKSYQVVDEAMPAAGPSGCIECHPKE
jgi:hypothetical protein